MWVIVVSVQGRQSFRILEDILSFPGALLNGILRRVGDGYSTWSSRRQNQWYIESTSFEGDLTPQSRWERRDL